jgi:hypothetical protein
MSFPTMWMRGLCELEADLERLEAKRQVYDPDDIARGGAFVILNHDAMVRIERGFSGPGTKSQSPRPSKRARPQWPVISRVETARRCGMRREKVRTPPTRKITTARCRIVLFAISRRIAPWGCCSI